MSKCYMCDLDGLTDEHCPPKCLFPKQKDLSPPRDLRKNLITVPSCEIHNSEKSTDDTYLLYVFSMTITSSDVGENQFFTKLRRAIERKPALMNALMSTNFPVTVKTEGTSAVEKTIAFKADRARIEDALRHTAHGLYYHENKVRFVGNVQVVPMFLIDLDDKGFNELQSSLGPLFNQLMEHSSFKGDNPEVFQYRIAENPPNNYFIEMQFYGGTTCYAIMTNLSNQKS